MNIILGKESIEGLDERYIVLPLDKLRVQGSNMPITAYCLVETVPLNEMLELEQFKILHEKLMDNYAKKNWNFCLQAIEHLMGKWNCDLDSFYQELMHRINKYQQQDPGETWDGTLETNNTP